MKFSLIMFIALTLGSLSAAVVDMTSSEYVPVVYAKSPTGRLLLKRSLCNTFGGCGTKRSLDSPRYSNYRIGDEASEEQRYDADAKMISEILEDIIEHLKKDQNYQQGKYVMLVPKRTTKGESMPQQSSSLDDGNRQNIRSDGIVAWTQPCRKAQMKAIVEVN